MKSKTSFFSRGVFLSDMKRFSWLCIAYLASLMFLLPIQLLLKLDSYFKSYAPGIMNPAHDYNPVIDLFRFESGDKFLLFSVPVAVAILLFRFLQSKSSADMYHSLPIGRSALLGSKLALGIVFLTVPLLITGATCIAIRQVCDVSNFYTINSVLNWMNISILLNIVIFAGTVFFGMITGSSIAQGAFTYIFLFFPVGMCFLLAYDFQEFLYGFGADYYLSEKIVALSPLAMIVEFSSSHFTIGSIQIASYIIVSAAFCIGAKLLYNVRSIEAYSNIIAFRVLEPVFKYGITFCTTLVGGIYFSQMGGSPGWVAFGYIGAAVLGYMISLMVIKKSFYIFKIQYFKGFAAYAAAALAITLFVKFDVVGFESKLPDASNVERVYFLESIYPYQHAVGTQNDDFGFYNTPQNIMNIVSLHESIIEDWKSSGKKFESSNSDRFDEYQGVALIYEMKDGSKLVRQYNIPKQKFKNSLAPIYESLEYKKMNYDILGVDISQIEKIKVSPTEIDSKSLSIISPDEISTFVSLAQKDLIQAKYDELQSRVGRSSSVEISLFKPDKNDPYCYGFGLDYGFENLNDWLEKNGYLERAMTLPEDIKYIVIEKRKTNDSYYIDMNEDIKRLEIKDPSQIKTCLDIYKRNMDSNSKYIMGLYFKNGESFYATFNNDSIPEFVSSYFK